jgi:hypothetical protein
VLRALARRGVIEADQIHRWLPATWDRIASSAARATSPALGRGDSTQNGTIRVGNPVPELPANGPPSSWQRVPRACGSFAPEPTHPAATSPPSTASIRTLSTRARDLPPRDLPPSLHPGGGREGDEMVSRDGECDGGLVPLARTATKLFAAQNVVVDLRHAVRRLAAARERYGMTDAELGKYLSAAPDQPGIARAGFPFGAALSPSRVEPWLEKYRRRERAAPERREVATPTPLSSSEIAMRGNAFLGSLARCRG